MKLSVTKMLYYNFSGNREIPTSMVAQVNEKEEKHPIVQIFGHLFYIIENYTYAGYL